MTARSVVRAAVDPAAWAVETTMYRALAVLRFVVLVNTVVVNLLKWEALARPVLAGAAIAALAGWTAFATWAYDEPRRRRSPLLVTDLLVAVGALLLTPVVQSPTQLEALDATLPSFYVMAVVLAWGIHWHWVGGLAAASVVSAADLAVRADVNSRNVGNIFLLMIGGPLLGYTTGLLKQMAVARDRAEREAAAAAERARLARIVHDGVLQVLSLVQRRGAELGGEAAELGRLAGEQEVALRSLVQRNDASLRTAEAPGTPDGPLDLAAALGSLQSPTVTVSLPGTALPWDRARGEEVVAVVRACLDNVRVHVGERAPAWVLVEDLGGSVTITVRDDGPGIPDGRLAEAEREGRLGVRQSICGRVADLGGTAEIHTGPGAGTEWEIAVPRDAPDDSSLPGARHGRGARQ